MWNLQNDRFGPDPDITTADLNVCFRRAVLEIGLTGIGPIADIFKECVPRRLCAFMLAIPETTHIVIAEEAGSIDSSEDSLRGLGEETRLLSRAYTGRPNGDVGTLSQN